MTTSGTRLHGIDALRAFAMLSGVVLHSILAYRVAIVPLVPHDPQFQHWIFDFVFFIIHSFRMPLFFLIAGFFCRMVYYKSGEKKFLQQRFKRIGIPFIAGVLIIAPLTLLPKFLYWYTTSEGLSLQAAFDKAITKILKFSEIEHIWFLRNLIVFYAAVILFERAKKIAFISNFSSFISNIWRKANINVVWLVLLTIPVWLCLMTMPGWYVTTDTFTLPRSLFILLYYAYFFGLGWLVHMRSDIFSLFTKRYMPILVSATVATLIVWYVKQHYEFARTPLAIVAATKFVAALQMVLLVCGISGLFLRLLNTENKTWRYLSDASYWVYLVHLAIIILLQWKLIDSAVPGILRFPVVLGAAIVFTFATYHYLVRYTFIGDILHGPRKRPDPLRKEIVGAA